MNVKDVKAKLVSDKNVDWEKCDPEFKYGTFIKKKLVKKQLEEGQTSNNGETEVIRKKLCAFALHLPSYDEKITNFLMDKYFND